MSSASRIHSTTAQRIRSVFVVWVAIGLPGPFRY
jgi:hypothetical protein